MSELEYIMVDELDNGIIIDISSDGSLMFTRGDCYIDLSINPEDIRIKLFYCSGGSSQDGSNQGLRGNGNGKKLMLDVLKYVYEKTRTTHAHIANLEVFLQPVPSLDTEILAGILEPEILAFIETNEEARESFQIVKDDKTKWPKWVKTYEPLKTIVKEKIQPYYDSQLVKLKAYYDKLGFEDEDENNMNGRMVGNIEIIIDAIKYSGGSRKNRKGKKSKKSKKSRKSKKSKKGKKSRKSKKGKKSRKSKKGKKSRKN